MSSELRYDASAALSILKGTEIEKITPALLAARDDAFNDIALLNSGNSIPAAKNPLDSGFIDLPAELLAEFRQKGAESLVGRMQAAATELRREIDKLVLLGIGGSYMGARALFEALCDPFHNQLTRDERRSIPRIYFEGNNIDNDSLAALLRLLKHHCRDKSTVEERWGISVISKSGGTLETAAAFRLFRRALEDYYGADSEESRRYVVPITGETGKLRELSKAKGYPAIFPIPDGVGGRFSVLTAVGLFPAAMLGLDIVKLLQGAADMTERTRQQPMGKNPVLDYTATCHVFEQAHGMHIRVLSTWGSRLEALGLWYDQLLSESLGKEEKGATPITVVNSRDLHSRGQQHQEGTRNKLITNVVVEAPSSQPISVPKFGDDFDDLNKHSSKTIPDMLKAAIAGTNRAYADVKRPTADIVLPKLDEYAVGQIFQMLMLATVVEGRLISINPYGQPGVEAYKKNMTAILAKK
ncbi:MAG: glucose-6-phosphate isomerase [Planctomycetaceae bacterium]